MENPLRKGAIGAFVKGVRSKEIDPPAWLKHHVVPVLAGSAVTIVAVIGLIVVPPISAIGAADLLKDEQAHTSQMPELPVDDAAAGSPKLDVLMIGARHPPVRRDVPLRRDRRRREPPAVRRPGDVRLL